MARWGGKRVLVKAQNIRWQWKNPTESSDIFDRFQKIYGTCLLEKSSVWLYSLNDSMSLPDTSTTTTSFFIFTDQLLSNSFCSHYSYSQTVYYTQLHHYTEYRLLDFYTISFLSLHESCFKITLIPTLTSTALPQDLGNSIQVNENINRNKN